MFENNFHCFSKYCTVTYCKVVFVTAGFVSLHCTPILLMYVTYMLLFLVLS